MLHQHRNLSPGWSGPTTDRPRRRLTQLGSSRLRRRCQISFGTMPPPSLPSPTLSFPKRRNPGNFSLSRKDDERWAKRRRRENRREREVFVSPSLPLLSLPALPTDAAALDRICISRPPRDERTNGRVRSRTVQPGMS